ncbi:MAG: hypothetical protein IPP49_15570 [Saprospiraceae bacterium]|nr:hypothetical protein [Saprospiraceae bacterium]
MENGKFAKKPIDYYAQLAPVYAIQKMDSDEKNNLILAGNQSKVRVKLGRLNGNHGQYYEEDKYAERYIPNLYQGLIARNDVSEPDNCENK